MKAAADVITRAVWLAIGLVIGASFSIATMIQMEKYERIEPAIPACLPDDKCLLHIVPFGKPHSALTCDLNANKCWDDRP